MAWLPYPAMVDADNRGRPYGLGALENGVSKGLGAFGPKAGKAPRVRWSPDRCGGEGMAPIGVKIREPIED